MIERSNRAMFLQPPEPVRRLQGATALMRCGLMIVATLGSCKKGPVSPPPVVVQPAAPSAEAVPSAPDSLREIYGRWVRDDGGYVLEIRRGSAGGVLDVSYFNPRSINVSRAAWYEGGGRIQILVELDDVGYPGSTYVLRYDPASDRLLGQYTQPSARQTFEIEFSRAAKP